MLKSRVSSSKDPGSTPQKRPGRTKRWPAGDTWETQEANMHPQASWSSRVKGDQPDHLQYLAILEDLHYSAFAWNSTSSLGTLEIPI